MLKDGKMSGLALKILHSCVDKFRTFYFPDVFRWCL